jgi:hypothetical protein
MTVKNVDNKQKSSLNNQFELTFSTSAMITSTTDNGSIKEQQLSLVKIDRISDCAVNSIIDVIGIVRVVGELTTVKSAKNDSDYIKRDLTLVDDSNCEIKVAIWGGDAKHSKYDWNDHPILCIQGAVVKQFTGRSLSLTPSSLVTVNPNFAEADALRDYRKQFSGGVVPAANSLSTNSEYRCLFVWLIFFIHWSCQRISWSFRSSGGKHSRGSKGFGVFEITNSELVCW